MNIKLYLDHFEGSFTKIGLIDYQNYSEIYSGFYTISMNAKVKIIVLGYTPIGKKAQKNVYFSVNCQTTKKLFKSPLILQPPSLLNRTTDRFWEFQLYSNQQTMVLKMIDVNQKEKAFQTISEVSLSKLNQLPEETEAMFYLNKQRIGVLSIQIQRQKQQKKPKINKKENLEKQDALKLDPNSTKMKPKQSKEPDDSENDRYDVQLTPHSTVNNSAVKIVKVWDHSQMNIFNSLDESSIEQRQLFSRDYESFYELTDQMQSGSKSTIKEHQNIASKLGKKAQQLQKQHQTIPKGEKNQSNSSPQEKLAYEKVLMSLSDSSQHISSEQKNAAKKTFKKSKKQSQTQNNNKIETQTSSLQKWLQKLQKFRKLKQKQTTRGTLYECIIPQKYKLKNEDKLQKDQKLANLATLNLLNLALDQTIDDSYGIKSLKMKVLDGERKNSNRFLFECSFSLANENEDNFKKEMKFKKLMTQIPQDVNVQVEIFLENLNLSESQETKISGILMKDKMFEISEIPLFDQDENIFASLEYSAKLIKNASVQYLSPLNSLVSIDPLQKTKITQMKEQPMTAKNFIRQRKINKMFRREALRDDDKKIQSPSGKHLKQVFLNSSVRQKIKEKSLEKIDSSPSPQQIPKKRKDSSFSYQIQRSNTDEYPYTNSKKQSKQQSQVDSKSSRQPSIKRLKSRIQKINEEMSRFTGDISLPISPTKNHNNHRLRLKSMTLADLREEESEDQEEDYEGVNNLKSSQKVQSFVGMQMPLFSPKKILKPKKMATEPDRDHGYEETIVHKDYLGDFVIEINAITVVLYEHRKAEDEQNGKFIILKSESGETFITDTLFSNHLNLNWKNKFYQFKSSKIDIGIYEKSGFSSQSQSKLIGNVALNLVDLMRAIKQNFHRAELFMNGKPIGIVILIYDIFMERESVLRMNKERNNASDIKMKNLTEKVTNNTYETDYQKQQLIRSEKSTIKVENKPKNRKRAKTLESHKRNIMLPVIDRTSNPSRRRPYYYEGGKNITIGRAQRFLHTNMAQVVGEW